MTGSPMCSDWWGDCRTSWHVPKRQAGFSRFCVGVVSEEKMIDGSKCRPGDRIIGLASSGPHSNGYSLVRKIFNQDELKGKFGLELLSPTKIYARNILHLIKKISVKAMAHITGGGFYENIPRSLPEGLSAQIKMGAWPILPLFHKIQKKGSVEDLEMFRTFNMGVGMTLIVSPKAVEKTIRILDSLGQKAWNIGEVVKGNFGVRILD